MTLDTLLTALDDAAGCGCCANRAPIADLLGIPHCADPTSGWCDDDEDFSGDAACPWHKADPSFRDLARAVLDLALAAARPHIETRALREAAEAYLAEFGTWGGASQGAWLRERADRIEADQ